MISTAATCTARARSAGAGEPVGAVREPLTNRGEWLFHRFPDEAVVVDGHDRGQGEQECGEDQDGPERPGGGDPVHPSQTGGLQVETVENGHNAGQGYPGYRHRGPYRVARDAQGGGQTLLIPSCDETDEGVQDEHRREEASDEQYGQRYQRCEHEYRQDANEL